MSANNNLFHRFVVALMCFGVTSISLAANRTWIGGNTNWDTDASKWTGDPPDEPDSDDVAIFSTANSVDLAIASQTIMGLTMSNGISLSLNGNDLTVNGDVELSDASTDLFVPTNSSLQADRIIINSGGDITLQGGVITVVEETDSGYLDVNDGGELSGNGTINFNDAVSAGATNLFNLDGELNAHSTAPLDLGSLAAATLTITVSDADGVIDLDGNDGVSTINVLRNDTLNLNGGVLDTGYSGTINLSSGATFSRNVPWSLNGTLNANTTVGDTAAAIDGAEFTQTGGSIVVDAGETLRLSSIFHGADGEILNNGLIIFENATIDNGSQFQTGSQGSIEVIANTVINDQGWDWDGDGGSNNVITIGNLGTLDANLTADDMWNGLMNIDGGTLFIFASDGVWGQDGGTINVNTGLSIFSDISGSPFAMTGGAFNVTAGGNLHFNCASTWSEGTLDVDGLLLFQSGVTFSGSTVTGNGTIVAETSAAVTANTTISVNTFDWDGDTLAIANTQTINNGVSFIINSFNFDDDDDMDDAINLGGNGAQLLVNSLGSWIMNNTLTANTAGAGTALIGGTSRMVLQSTLDVNGNTTVSAPITFDDGSATSIDSGRILSVTSANTVYGDGTITGLGTFRPGSSNTVDTTLPLPSISVATFDFDAGNWTVNPARNLNINVGDYDLDATNAFDSTITVNGGHVTILTGDPAFVLNNGTINLNGPGALWSGEPLEVGDDAGALASHLNVGGSGTATITPDVTFKSDADVDIAAGATLQLIGDVTFLPVNVGNNAEFTGGGTLLTQTHAEFSEATTLNMVGGSIDFDGTDFDTTGNLIEINAPVVINAASLVPFGREKDSLTDNLEINHESHVGSLTVNLDDPNGEWTLNESGQMVLITNFVPATLLAGSDVNLNGSVFVGGPVQIAARVDVGSTGEINIFDAAGSLTLSGGSVNDPNTIDGGAINGPGELIIGPGTALAGNGTISALINQGTLMPGTSPGQISVETYTQTANAVLEMELGGTGPNDFDQLIVTAQAVLDGTLNLSLIDGFVPSGGDTFEILNGGALIGAFANVQLPPLQGGLVWNTNELYTAGVLSVDGLLGDYNYDNTVDAADYVWWRKFDGLQPGYDRWREHFGETVGGGVGAAFGSPDAAVPEPSSLALLLCTAIGLVVIPRRFRMSGVKGRHGCRAEFS